MEIVSIVEGDMAMHYKIILAKFISGMPVYQGR